MKLLYPLIFILLTTKTQAQTSQILVGTSVLDATIVIDSSRTTSPWDICWGPDGRLWMTDARTIKVWNPANNFLKTLFTIPNKGYGMGLALPTTLSMSGFNYIYSVFDTSADYYANGVAPRCALIRFRYEMATDTLVGDTVLMSYPHIGEHSGGRVIIGQDGKIYVTTADYSFAKDTLNSTWGKVLRINPDGSVPNDNPRADYTWSYGHRNIQGLVQLANGTIWATELGQSNDEVNLILKGKNYGWPAFDGNTYLIPDSCTSPSFLANYMEPKYVFQSPPSGIEYYDHPSIKEFKNSLLIAKLGGLGGQIFHLGRMNSTQDTLLSGASYPHNFKRIRDFAVAPDGSVYFIAYDRSDPFIVRLSYPSFNAIAAPAATDEVVSVYPNPADNALHIVLKNYRAGITFSIFDALGKNVRSGAIENHTVVDIARLAAATIILSL